MDVELESERKSGIDEEDICSVTVNDLEGVPAEEGNSESDTAAEEPLVIEAAASSEPEPIRGKELAVGDSEDLTVKSNEVKEQTMSHEESAVFEVNSLDDDRLPTMHPETLEGENISPAQEVEAEAEEPAAPADKDDFNLEEHEQLLRELSEERDKASQRSSRLQTELVEYFNKKAGDDRQPERELQVSEQLQEYEKHMNILSDLKQQLLTDSEAAQQQAEEQRLQSQERLDKVENEWRAFVALKKDVAVTALSRCLGKQAALAKVESILATEQIHQDELRHKNIQLRIGIQQLEAELRGAEEHGRDSLQLQFEKLQGERLQQKKQAERLNEEALKIQTKISSSLELLSNVKEKLFWSHMEVQAKREQLAEVEAMVAKKRDLLTRTKRARNSLQRDNLRLKERRGLIWNRVLLQDFEDTVDASNRLEEQLENLKAQQAEIVFRCGR